jgi:membrane protease YdiL (CAAX protease family)
MAIPDLLYLALIGLGLLLDHFVLWPAFLRRSHVDPGRARAFLWAGWIILLWALAAAGIALWLVEARAWAPLRLEPPHGWRLWVAITLVLALMITYARTVMRIAQSERPRRVKMGRPGVESLVPHNRSELRSWIAVSVSAGFCEEFIFRGYLIWAFQPVVGLWGAAAFSVVLFAAAHAYQGALGVVASGAVGAVLTLVVLAFGSLLPAMALHAILDIGQGLVAWLVLRGGSAATQNAEIGTAAV